MPALEAVGSIKDPRVVEARSLATSAGRLAAHKCLLHGQVAVRWARAAGLRVDYVFAQARLADDPLVVELTAAGVPCLAVSEGIGRKITDTSYAVPLVGVARLPADVTQDEAQGLFVLVLDRVVDHGNLGTIVRSASAFGIRDLVVTDPRTDLFFPKIVEASRGTVFSARVRRSASSLAATEELHARGYQVVATSSYARNLQAVAPLERRPLALVVGNETDGVSPAILERADAVVQIPMSGEVESLNVGVAAGISMYELKLRLVLVMLVQQIRSIFGRELGVTALRVRQAFDAQVRQVSGLTGIQVVLLMMLEVDQTMPLDRVARETGTLTEELDGLLAPLVSQRLIRADARSLALTEAGGRALAQLWPVVERADRQELAGFSDAEAAQLRAFLERIQRNCAGLVGS